jgi:hypothetical protein
MTPRQRLHSTQPHLRSVNMRTIKARKRVSQPRPGLRLPAKSVNCIFRAVLIISVWSNIHDDTIEPSGGPAQQREGRWQHGSQSPRLRQSLVRWIIFVRRGLEERGCAARLFRRRGDQNQTNWTICMVLCMA